MTTRSDRTTHTTARHLGVPVTALLGLALAATLVATPAAAQTFCNGLPGGVPVTDHAGGDVFLLSNTQWTGAHCNIGTLTVGEAFTLSATPGEILVIQADRVDIAGRLSADAAGGAGGTGGGRGEGGAGGSGTGSGGPGVNGAVCPAGAPPGTRNAGGGGGGGAGYAGSGGAGGHGADANDGGCQSGAGGSAGGTYGSTSTPAVGSGGGGGGGAGGPNYFIQPSAPGGRGGGLLRVEARTLTVTGRISADGGNGGNGGSSPDSFHGGGGGGGASGGGIHLRATTLSGTGTISAQGGRGGNGGQGSPNYQGAGGGGGGGGRVLIQRSDGTGFTGSCSVGGGLSGTGTNGDGGPGAAGGNGNCVTESHNGAPTADAGGPYLGQEGQDIALDGSGSSDPDGAGSLSYTWDFECNGSTDATGVSAIISFDDDIGAGEPVPVCLTVSDGEYSHRDTGFVIVIDAPPVGVISVPATALEAATFSVDANGSYADGGDGSIDDAIVSYEWDFDYSDVFTGDGLFGSSQTYSYADNGRRFMAVQVVDEDGGTGLTVAAIDILNVPPQITSTAPNTATEAALYSYQIEIVDPGTLDTFSYEVVTGPAGMAVSPTGLVTWTPSYAHAVAGSVTAVFAVIDDDFGRDTEQVTITVVSADSDDDQMPDGWELLYDLNPNDPADADFDPDMDGVSNVDEFLRGTSPLAFDGPGAPRLASPPVGFEVALPVELPLVVFEAVDPDDSPLTYRFRVFDANPVNVPAANVLAETEGVVPADLTAVYDFEDDGTLLSDNTRYYWRAWANDGLVFGPASQVGNFFVNNAEDCPTAPTLLSPGNRGFISVANPVLTIGNSVDLDQDPIVYVIVIYRDELLQRAALNSGVLAEGNGGVTTWEPNLDLDDNTEYWWRAQAIDGEGCASPFSPVFSFFTTFDNESPSAPVVVLPEAGSTVREARPEIVVSNAADPNRDPLVYYFELDRADTFDTLDYQASGAVEEESVTTAWRVVTALVDDATYFVRVRAFDGELSGPYGTSSFRVNHTNDLPTAPVPIAPLPDGTIATQRPRLTVENAVDADGETLVYHFQIFGDDQLADLVAERTDVPESFATSFWRVNFTLLSGPYWWRARALDNTSEGPWSELVRFNIQLQRTGDGGPVTGPDPNAGVGDDGCGCASAPGAPSVWTLLLGLGVAVALRRRR